MTRTKYTPFLTRRHILGHLKGYKHDLYKMITAPLLPRGKLKAIQDQILAFFQDPYNKNQVFFQSLILSNCEYIIYAVKIKTRISIMIITDNIISEIIHLK